MYDMHAQIGLTFSSDAHPKHFRILYKPENASESWQSHNFQGRLKLAWTYTQAYLSLRQTHDLGSSACFSQQLCDILRKFRWRLIWVSIWSVDFILDITFNNHLTTIENWNQTIKMQTLVYWFFLFLFFGLFVMVANKKSRLFPDQSSYISWLLSHVQYYYNINNGTVPYSLLSSRAGIPHSNYWYTTNVWSRKLCTCFLFLELRVMWYTFKTST